MSTLFSTKSPIMAASASSTLSNMRRPALRKASRCALKDSSAESCILSDRQEELRDSNLRVPRVRFSDEHLPQQDVFTQLHLAVVEIHTKAMSFTFPTSPSESRAPSRPQQLAARFKALTRNRQDQIIHPIPSKPHNQERESSSDLINLGSLWTNLSASLDSSFTPKNGVQQ
jgi:hypothetical protein